MDKEVGTSHEWLRAVYLDVLNGYTFFSHEKFGEAYIKHLSTGDSINLDAVRREHEKVVRDLGLPSEEEQEELLDKEGIWTKKDQLEIAELTNYIKNLKETRSKIFLHSQKQEMSIEIEKKTFELQKLAAQRDEYMHHTSDKYVNKKVNEYYSSHILYKDKECTELKWSDEEWNDLDDMDTLEIIKSYNKSTSGFSTDGLKKVALAPFFTNIFYMCDNNPYYFYGKPVVSLTYFQVELMSFGMYYKHMMTDGKAPPPADIMENPDKLQEWYEGKKASEEILEKMEDKDAVSLVGATKDDLKRLGLDPDKDPTLISLSKEAAKRGGTLDMEDFIEIHEKIK